MDDQSQMQTQDDFQQQLESLICDAARNDIDVVRGWSVTDTVGSNHYEALITEVAKAE